MKSIYTTTTKYVALAFSLLLAACTTDLYEDKETPIVEPEEKGLNIPDDFDFATISTRTITVNIMDEYDGQKYYMLEGYDDNPVFNPSATLLFREKTKGNVPCVVKDVVFANTAKNFYIRQTDPYGLKTVYAIPLEETDNLVCDLKPAEAPVSKASVELRSDFSSIFEVPSDAKEISKASDIKNNRVYHIPEGNTITFNKSYKPNGNGEDLEKVTLYIAGTLNFEVGEFEFKNDCQLVVLPGGKIIGGNSVKLEFETGSDLYNRGDIKGIWKLSMDGKNKQKYSTLYNGNTIEVHQLEIEETDLYNDCLIKVEETFKMDDDGSHLHLNSGALICQNLKIGVDDDDDDDDNDDNDTSHISFKENAILQGENAMIGQHVVVKGADNSVQLDRANYGIFYFNTLNLNYKYGAMEVYGAVEFACTNRLGGDEKFTTQPTWSETRDQNDNIIPSISINPDKCNGELSNTPPTEDQGGGGSTDINPGEGYVYTYLFEDNWPSFGDYDMNDLVVDIDIANQEITGGNAKRAVITATLQAVGATKGLYVFVRASNIDKEEVALFEGKEAHACFGLNRSQMINTDEHKVDPFTHQTTVDLTGGELNSKNLDVFIVSGNPEGKNRNEIHLVNIKGTGNAASSPTSVDYKYIDIDGEGSKYNNMVWGVMIPQSQQRGFKYPKELNSIMEVYPDFVKWAQSGGKDHLDWYKYPQGSVYEGR